MIASLLSAAIVGSAWLSVAPAGATPGEPPASVAPGQPPAAVQPEAAPPAVDEELAEELRLLARFLQLPAVSGMPAADAVRIRLDSGMFTVETALPETSTRSRVPLTDAPGTTVFTVIGRLPVGGAAPGLAPVLSVQLIHHAAIHPAAPGQAPPAPGPDPATAPTDGLAARADGLAARADGLAARRIEVIASHQTGAFQLIGNERYADRDVEIQLIQVNWMVAAHGNPDNNIRLLVRESDRATGEITFEFRGSGADVAQLRRRHPVELMRFVRPLLDTLRQDPGLLALDVTGAWQVLGGGHVPDPELMRQVDRILIGLDAEAFADRQAAVRQLQELGQRGANAVRIRDRAGLSAQQNAELDAFLRPFTPLSGEEVARLGRNRQFLLECLLAEDAELRRLAWGRLREVVEVALPFDPDAGPEVRAAQVARLSAALAAPIPPAP